MTFQDYLMQQYIDEEHPLDDDIADGFPNWYSLQIHKGHIRNTIKEDE